LGQGAGRVVVRFLAGFGIPVDRAGEGQQGDVLNLAGFLIVDQSLVVGVVHLVVFVGQIIEFIDRLALINEVLVLDKIFLIEDILFVDKVFLIGRVSLVDDVLLISQVFFIDQVLVVDRLFVRRLIAVIDILVVRHILGKQADVIRLVVNEPFGAFLALGDDGRGRGH
jgi:hypothetical protein